MADEPEKPKFDRFKPAAPKIPGVSDPSQPAQAPTAEAPVRKIPKEWMIRGGAAIGFLLLALVLWLATRTEPLPVAPSAAQPASDSATPAATAPRSPAAKAPGSLPVAPGPVASVQEFPAAWSAKKFLFRKLSEEVSALVVRLPGGSPRSPAGYWAFSLGRPNEECELQFITDLPALARDYGFRAQHPMVVDPCSRSVYDPLKLGDVGGAWVRGDVVKGSAYRPPLSILLRVEGNSISAVQIE